MLQKILSNMRKAIEDYRMIEDGDHIAVGVSGGKDSLVLLMGLKELQRFLPVKFNITAVTLTLGFPDFDTESLIAFYRRLGVNWHIEETSIGKVVFETRKEKSPCALCAKMKRGTIHATAKKLGCNKVAFGHHMDDAIETMMLSLIYEGRLHCFSPVTHLSRSDVVLIRPLIYVEEKQIRSCVRSEGILPIKSGCPAEGHTKRMTVKAHIASLRSENPTIRAALFGAIQRAGLNGWKVMGYSSQFKKGHPDLTDEKGIANTTDKKGIANTTGVDDMSDEKAGIDQTDEKSGLDMSCIQVSLPAAGPPASREKEAEEKRNPGHERQVLVLDMLLQLYHPTDLGQSYINALGLTGQYLDLDRVSLFTYQYDGSLRLRQEWNAMEAPFTGKGMPNLSDRRSKALSKLADWMITRPHYDTDMEDDAPAPVTGEKPDLPYPWAAQTLCMSDKPVALLFFEDFQLNRTWSEDDRTTLDAAKFIMTLAHERRQTDFALHAATRRAQDGSLTKGRFLANMTHELRTPMNAIIGYLDLLETTLVSDEQQNYIQEAKTASDMLLFLINDVLDYSKIEAGHLSFERIPFSLRTCVEHAAVMHMPNAQAKGVEIGILVDPSLPDAIMGDPARLEQILTNLISNAIKFTMRGDVLIEVYADSEENASGESASEESGDMTSIAGAVFPYLATDGFPGQMQMLVQPTGKTPAESSGDAEVRLVLRVSDSGIGMSRDTIRQLYQPFTQADSSTTRRFGGTGLGLAITHRLVEMLHGRIDVESHEGKGTSFSCHIAFTLPAEDEDAGKGLAPFHTLYGHGSVLIVEGSRMQGRILDRYLSAAGYDCVLADSSVDALSRMTGGRMFDSILLSTSLTDYPVRAFIELLRNLPAGAGVPILLLGSFAQREPSAVRLGDQVQGTLTRPFRYHDLLLLMKSVHEHEGQESTGVPSLLQSDSKDEYAQMHLSDESGAYERIKDMRNSRFTDRFRDSGNLEEPVNPADFRLPSVLLVEDNPTNRIVFENLLRTYGLSCDTANDGMEAVVACEHHAYDIIFMDCQMPVLDGFAAARIIRGAGSSRKAIIIALTARTLSSDRDKCLESGMDEHIGKPITMAVLFARLDVLMNQLGYIRPLKPLPRTFVKTYASVESGNPVGKTVPGTPGTAVESCGAGEPEAPGWPEDHPANKSIRFLMQIPGMSRNEIICLIRLFLQELDETITIQPNVTRDEFISRAHRLRGAAGSLQLQDFLSQLNLMEDAARGGDHDGLRDARDNLKRMHHEWSAE